MKPVYISDDLHLKLKKKALDENQRLQELVMELIERGLENA